MIEWVHGLTGATPDGALTAIVAAGGTLLAAIVAICLSNRGNDGTGPTPQEGDHGALIPNVDEITNKYIALLEAQNESLKEEIVQRDTLVERAITDAVEDLAEEAAEADDSAPFEAALAELSMGRPEAAEALFREILEERLAAGTTMFKEAAEAARHVGALAFYHDTEKALAAYIKGSSCLYSGNGMRS